jgi:hypothetical protein
MGIQAASLSTNKLQQDTFPVTTVSKLVLNDMEGLIFLAGLVGLFCDYGYTYLYMYACMGQLRIVKILPST